MAAVAVCACGAAQGQGAAASEAPKLQMMAKDADPGWEVVTVRPSDPNDKVDRIYWPGRHVVVENETVETMLLVGYGVQRSQILNAPDWVKTECWDVDGVPDKEGKPDVRQVQGMLRKLLEERFGLKLHHEQREMPVFALTVTKGGPKMMTKSTGDLNGLPHQEGSGSNGRQIHHYENVSMADLALMLLIYTDRPIVDHTGVSGRYDFNLTWASDEMRAAAPDAPGLFTAIQEQLGLKLEPVKAAVDVMVVDKVEKPGAN